MPKFTLRLDSSTRLLSFRPLHGVNNGPFAYDGVIDTSPLFHEARIPDVRIHDPLYPGRNVVDINAVFPNHSADPDDPASYDFVRTDHYLQNIAATGAKITYRLGYTIDHHPVKRYSLPPANDETFARICLGIARHYTEGWANGFANLVHRWEIWNEPDLFSKPDQPSPTSTTWQGSWADYFRLYQITATMLKRRLPHLSVGGPALSESRDHKEFLARLLAHCRSHSVPVDFVSWHTYTHDPYHVQTLAREARQIADAAGYTQAANLLTEWHYIPPGMDWSVIMTPCGHVRKRQLLAEMNSDRSAAFTAATLLLLQDAPLDMASFYTGDTTFFFGMFDAVGGPLKPYYAILAFSRLLECTHRISIPDELPPGLFAAAGILPDGRTRLLVVNNRDDYSRMVFPAAPKTATCRLVSSLYDLSPWPMDTDSFLIPAWAIALVDLSV